MKINNTQIVSVSAYDMEQAVRFEYRKEIKIFGLTIRKGGFYRYVFFSGYKRIEQSEILKDERYRIVGEKVFYKPHCEVKMSNGQKVTKFFSCVAEMKEYMKSFDSFMVI